ncbi:MAG: hypothetical protein HGA96_15510 [Desulfobulbaceae bacterium]|nr:hypothetical protein [Desulfobulbaceae bacterium]
MEPVKTYENFPLLMILSAALVNVSIYALGVFILSGFGYIMATLYLLYYLGIEIHLKQMSCVDCYYYGKWCAFGRGKVAALFFKHGETKRFPAKCMSWKELLPDMLATLIPLFAGIAILSQGFT